MSAPVTFISGGAGYAGRFITNRLLEAGHRVIVAGRQRPPLDHFVGPVAYAQLSLDVDTDYARLFEEVDYFVHAAFAHVEGRYRGGEGDDPAGFRRRNLTATNALFDAAKLAGVRRAVFLSSRAAYGVQPPGMALSETTRPHPETLYGEVKLAAERHLRQITDERFVGLSLRVTGIYGPTRGRDDKWTALMRQWLSGDVIEPRAGTEVHGDDVALAVERVLEVPAGAVASGLFNVSDIVADRADILAIAQRVIGEGLPVPPPADMSRLNVMETSRLRSLGWHPGGVRRFQETVRQLAERLAGLR
jgi:nucleoside-diphosphate-sugar epimerase